MLIKIENLFITYLFIYLIFTVHINNMTEHAPASPASASLIVPSHCTVDTWDLNRDLGNGTPVNCSHCGKACTSKEMRATENRNLNHRQGSCVIYVIVHCSGQCQKDFFKQCNAALPFGIECDIIFAFDPEKDGGPEGYWKMYSNVPEDGGWIIYKSTDEGHSILDDKGRPIWMRIDDSTLRQACRYP